MKWLRRVALVALVLVALYVAYTFRPAPELKAPKKDPMASWMPSASDGEERRSEYRKEEGGFFNTKPRQWAEINRSIPLSPNADAEHTLKETQKAASEAGWKLTPTRFGELKGQNNLGRDPAAEIYVSFRPVAAELPPPESYRASSFGNRPALTIHLSQM